MGCHQEEKGKLDIDGKMKILLMGNPNVGKSVVFSKLTGVHVESSNYAGTTVDYKTGEIKFGTKESIIIDVPGTYSLEATSEAEQVAVDLLNEGADAIICVLDATNLDRNLDLALQLREYNIPIVYSLNLTDVAERQGIKIDVEKLSEDLDAPVIPTIAIKNIGLRDILMKAYQLKGKEIEPVEKLDYDQRWKRISEISKRVESKVEVEKGFIDKLENWTIQPWPGIPMAIVVLLLSIGAVVGLGKGLRALILLPLVRDIYAPLITNLVSQLVAPGIFRNMLVGEFGVLIIGVEWPFALILPYVSLFYMVFSFLEDSGYLPRVAVLADGVLRRMGIQGGNIIPLMMGYGCAVPAIIGTKAATTYKERIIVATLVSFAIPCASQSAAFMALLGDRSIFALIFMFLLSLLVLFTVGIIMNKIIPGQGQPMLLEVPNLLFPDKDAFLKKFKLRMRHFLLDAEGAMLIGIAVAAVVAETGILNSFSNLIEPLVEGWLGLPREASLSLLLGVIRRELAVLPLLDMDLTMLQLLVGSTVALFYLPCLSVFGVLTKEFSLKVAVIIGISTIFSAFFFAGIVNIVGTIIIGII